LPGAAPRSAISAIAPPIAAMANDARQSTELSGSTRASRLINPGSEKCMATA
jgi:hypothetical protein